MTGSGVKFLNAEDVERAIVEVAGLSKGMGASPMLVDGAAMQLYGSDRMTRDVDFVVKKVPPRIRVEKKLSFGGVSGKTPEGFPVCFIVRSDDFKKLYIEAHRKSVAVSGLAVRVVAPAYLAAMKLVAGRQKDEEDLRTLLRNRLVNLKKARELMRRILGAFAVKEFDSYVDEVEWRRSRGE